MEEKEDTNKEVTKNSEQTELFQSGEEKTFNCENQCPKCGSTDLEFDESDGDSDTTINENNGWDTYSYFPFTCKDCKCKAIEVRVEKYLHTEIDEEDENDEGQEDS